ncbi:acyl-CoA N-acyltransferase [Cucurbitaria berberidis CBS 394.84]|uniref:Acyl-CoA N-acyltransferase n=1 Tax=Cucurbitaria berberidis CBS 394.84 TaxID=1168544 RepID=A0A9P4LAV8_9PLEO|nr:acyl-CoA N-acyltransferase [Cucurbitaria berberidis CBS 394.84]KAF1848841.1 acyl-CoA N-acyltransferase [Cucurbitaria berberidis CBS 394.84]
MSVTVEQYNPEWPQQFQTIKSELETYLKDVAYLSIEHIGSTSVPGLAAKPIIDTDIIVTQENVQPAIDALISNGNFDYLGELGLRYRHVMKDPNQSPRRNIYVCVDGVAQTRNHLGLRDTLRRDVELRNEYARLKLELASKNTNIIDYTVAKGVVVNKILEASGILSKDELAAIKEANTIGENFSALRTERLLLREFVMADAEGYFELESNEENARYQDWPPRTKEQARQLVINNLRDHNDVPRINFELAVDYQGHFVGRVGANLSPANNDKLPGESTIKQVTHANLWFSFLPSVQGKGFATEAMQAFIQALTKRKRGAEEGGKWEFEIECDPRNTGSWKLAERLGFVRHSLTKEAWQSKGEWVDSLVYRKVVGDA